ncbi:tRNA (N(6)-L-threonylcarbamoyladenosine(37)-C(2))-methylthiotransferase [Candidatus Woesearchaeota archaeon]|nr:tRNA (N(6)-L-threonylcarbamoyladenosine(37)-C(2))-methylthiotransferase [Candidatus Woesearchaeota archaeon]
MTKVFIKTFGCSLNQSDSEVMAGLLKKANFEIVKNSKEADLIIINSCTVKRPTEKRFFKYLEKVKELEKPIIIAGCIPQTDPEKVSGYSLVGTSQINNIVEIVEETINGGLLVSLTEEKNQRLNLPKIRKNPVVEIIPISEGCLGEPCAYCKVKSARGDLKSYAKEDVLRQINHAVREGVKEIWITAQDTGCYGKDINESLPSLLKEVINIPGDFKIRLGMANPNHILEFLDKLIEVYKSEKMFKFLHVPVQSGNNDILKAMRRKYTVEEFKHIIKRFRKAIPDISIATDIICGFPGETEEQFDDSLKLIKEIKPDVLNRSRFWPRPKTEAADMEDQIHGKETKRRSQLITSIFHNISRMNNERWLDWIGEIIIDEKGKDGTFIGRNFAYKPVVVSGKFKIGDKVKVIVRKITAHYLRANQ